MNAASSFRHLHRANHLLVLPNAWDAASAAFEQYKLGVAAQAETAKSEIAKANARTAEAELRIKRLEPRNLNWAAFVDALHKAPQSKVEILYFADDFDSMSLAQQIALAIKASGGA